MTEKTFDTDKFGNDLIPDYENLLTPYKDRPIKILEVGVLHGGFLEWLHAKLPQAELYGIDIAPVQIPGAKVFNIDQMDVNGLESFGEKMGPFDIIIDDASHEPTRTWNTYNALWKRVTPGGIYVIEDWIIGYWAQSAPATYGQGKGMIEVVCRLMLDKEKEGIGNIGILLKEPRCSLAVFTKKV